MSKYLNGLTKLGFNNIEAKTYLAALELGSGTAIEISKESGIPRTSVYDAINSLRDQELIVESYNNFGKKVFIAESPQRIFNYILKKKDTLSNILPVLMGKYGKSRVEPKIEILPASSAFRKWIEIVLAQPKGSLLRSVGDSLFHKRGHIVPSKEVEDYFYTRLEKKIPTKAISSVHILKSEVRKLYTREKNLKQLRRMKYFPNIEKFDFMFEGIGDFLYIRLSSLDKVRILIKNCELAGVFENIFDLLWKGAHQFPNDN